MRALTATKRRIVEEKVTEEEEDYVPASMVHFTFTSPSIEMCLPLLGWYAGAQYSQSKWLH